MSLTIVAENQNRDQDLRVHAGHLLHQQKQKRPGVGLLEEKTFLKDICTKKIE